MPNYENLASLNNALKEKESLLKEEREKNEQTARSLSAAKDELSRLEDEQNSLKDASAKQIYWQNEQENCKIAKAN